MASSIAAPMPSRRGSPRRASSRATWSRWRCPRAASTRLRTRRWRSWAPSPWASTRCFPPASAPPRSARGGEGGGDDRGAQRRRPCRGARRRRAGRTCRRRARRVAGRRRPARPAPPGPVPAVAIVLTSGTTGRPKGAVFTGAQLAAITRYDVGDGRRWGGGGPMLAGTQFAHVGFMTKLAWYLRTGATADAARPLARRRRARRVDAARAWPAIGGVAPQLGAACCATPASTRCDLSCVQALIVGRRRLAPGAGRGGPGRASAPRTRSATRPPSRAASAPARRSTPPDDEALHTVGRPRPGHGRRDPATTTGRPVAAPARWARCCIRSGAVMERYWNDPEATADDPRATAGCAPATSAASTTSGCLTLAGRQKRDVHPRRLQRVPDGGRGGAGRPPRRGRRWRSCPDPTR